MASVSARLLLLLVLVATAGGAVQAAPSVSAASTAGASGLDLDGEGSSQTHIVKVADLAASTDGAAGFTVSIGSGSLQHGQSVTPIAFQAALVSDGSAPPSSSAFSVASGGIWSWTTSSAGADVTDLYIMYSPADLQNPGSYSAAISISIVDN